MPAGIIVGVVAYWLALPPCAADERISLDGEWRFWTDAESYSPIQVPFSQEPRGTINAYQKIFTLPPGVCADFALLRFDGVVGLATIYLNGVTLGHHGSYTPFWFDVSALLRRNGENDLIVTIDDRADATTVPYEDIPWVNYSGLSRSVYLECSAGVSLLSLEPQYGFSNGLSHVDGQVVVRAAGRPGVEVSIVGFLLDGRLDNWTVVAALGMPSPTTVGADGLVSVALPFSLDNPQLWSPDSPKLYYLYVMAMIAGETQSERLVSIGFRDVRVQGNDILLNGQPLLFRGISRHDIYPGTGYVGTEAQMADDMTRIKATGANYVRLIHYPHHPQILDLADQLGLLVSEEVPAWANFGDPAVRQNLYTLIEEMIRRDMHHPSVFLWISGNARAYPMPYALEAQQLIRRLDRNRLGSYVIDNDQYDPETIAADVAFFREAGLDLYMKITWWFYYVEFLQDAWANFPKDLPIVIAEFGREGNDREPIVVDGDQTYWWGEDQQADAIAEMLEAWRPHLPQYDAVEHISGLCLFNFQDTAWPDIERYLPHHVHSLHWGLFYDDRAPKQALRTLSDFYSALPTGFVGLPKPDDAEVERRFHLPAGLGSPLNAAYRDSGPSVSADGKTLYFVSDGLDYIGRPRIFHSTLESGVWGPPLLVDIPQEAEPFAFRRSPCISYDGQTLYFTRAVVSGIYVARTRIWQSRMVSGAWSLPEDLGDTVNYPDAARVTSDPSISADGTTLYFSSDRPGGSGRTDLWMSQRVEGAWTQPVNLGGAVNSAYGDSEPCISSDGQVLYFSSDRPGGVGSSDIWVSHLRNGVWTAPKNIGPELNSPGAEREPELSKNRRFLFFTGARAGGMGLSDLWRGVSVFVRPDLDEDNDVDMSDFGAFSRCFNGPNRLPPAGCVSADFDADADVDLEDYGVLRTCFNGPNCPPLCSG